MSGCPVQITSASYTYKDTKLSRLDQESRRESTVFQPEKPTIPRVRIPRKILQIGYSDTPGEKRWKFFKLFFDGKPSPVLPSFLVRIVQDGQISFAVRFATFLLPGLYNLRVCHLFYLTGLSARKVSPDATFRSAPLYIHFAVKAHSDLPYRHLWIVGKTGVFNPSNTL